MPYYVQRQPKFKEEVMLETVDEAATRKLAAELAVVYREGDPSAIYYVSHRPCVGWKG